MTFCFFLLDWSINIKPTLCFVSKYLSSFPSLQVVWSFVFSFQKPKGLEFFTNLIDFHLLVFRRWSGIPMISLSLERYILSLLHASVQLLSSFQIRIFFRSSYNDMVTARIKPFSKSEWMYQLLEEPLYTTFESQARTSFHQLW